MSSGSESTTSGPPEWATPYFKSFLDRSQQTADLPYQPYTGSTVAQLNPYQTAGLDAVASRAMQGSPVTSAASGELQRTLGGGYLGAGNYANPYAGSNPYLGQAIDTASQDTVRNFQNAVTPQLDAMEARSGSFGNSGLQQVRGDAQRTLAKQLGDISSGMRFQDYGLQGQYGESAANRASNAFQAERGRMQGSVGMAPSIAGQDYTDATALLQAGGQYQGQEQANQTDAYQRFLEARGYPKEQLATQGMGLGANYGQSTTGPGANKTGGMMGGALTGAQLGGMVGGPYGAAIGGVGGGIAGGK